MKTATPAALRRRNATFGPPKNTSLNWETNSQQKEGDFRSVPAPEEKFISKHTADRPGTTESIAPPEESECRQDTRSKHIVGSP